MAQPRTLHLCNLANVAYGYCKILNESGHELSLRCHDLKHLMSQPEWDDLELRAEDFPDEYDFYNNEVDFGDYLRPDWFLSVGILPEHFREVSRETQVTANQVPATPPAHHRLRPAWNALPQSVRRLVKTRMRTAQFARSAQRSTISTRDALRSYQRLTGERMDYLVERSAELGSDLSITRDMMGAFVPHAWWTEQHAQEADLLFAYVLTPIYAMLLGDRPYVTVEIGTMRDIPFDGTDTGKLLANAYRWADHAIITNPDVRKQADQLGVESYSFCPHPLDEDTYADPTDDAFGVDLRAQCGSSLLLFAPARQNWEVKGNDRYLRAFARLRRDGADIALIIPGWGQEVERSQELCKALGIEDSVFWIPPQSEALLVKYYRAADIVLDQFILGVFGLTTPKAMAAGAAVLTSYEPDVHEWAFDEHPPLIPASTEDEIFHQIRALVDAPEHLARTRAASQAWVADHHSKAFIQNRLEEAMAIANDRFMQRTGM